MVIYDIMFQMTFKNQVGIMDIINTMEMKQKRDSSCCEKCGTCINLTIHHKDRSRMRRFDIDNMMVVCRKCHDKIHEEERGCKEEMR